MRHSLAQVDEWRKLGFVQLPGFFASAEISPLLIDFESLYSKQDGEAVEGIAKEVKKDGQIGATHPRQFLNIDTLPYNGSSALNLISMHPALIALAKDLLGVRKVHLYQSHTWAKFTGEADYDQAFHCDFGNHTLTVPSDLEAARTVDFIVYLTDVTDDLGALHYVTKPDAYSVLGNGAISVPESKQKALQEYEKSAAGPSGTVLAHGIDTFHRGTNLVERNGKRYMMTIGYKAAGNEMIGFHVWQAAADRSWDTIIEHGTPEQLEVLGIPRPGDTFWSHRTLELTQKRWPNWNMTSYFRAVEKRQL